MIKFRAIIIDKRKQDHANEILKIASKEIKVTSQVKLLGGKIDKLNFEQHIHRICKFAKNQLNVFITLKCFIGFHERKVLVNNFVLSNCTLIWIFASSKSY